MPLPYRWLTSLLVRYNGASLLIDCGEGTQIAMKQKGWSFKPIDMICFTHFHGDHISGLPGLLLSMGNAERTEPLTLVGPKGLEKIVRSLRVIAPELPFPIRYEEIQGDQQTFSFGGCRLKAFKVRHSILCYGYTLELDRAGRFHPEKAKENDVPMKYWSRLQKGEEIRDGQSGRLYTPSMVLGEARKGLKLTYTTDTRPTESIVENARGADLFICEGMYGEKDKEEKAKQYRHMTFYEAAALAQRAQARELWLTHFSPSMPYPEEYMGEVRRIFPGAKAGKDGMSTVLRFEEDV